MSFHLAQRGSSRLALMAATLLLAACATPPLAEFGAVTSGRLVLRAAADGDRQAQNVAAAFELQGNDQQGELRLLSPLGTQLAAARWSPGQVSLHTSGGTQRFATLNDLSQQILGEALPLAALSDWLRGRPWRQAPHQLRADGFEQLGWHVQLAGMADGLIEARRLAAPDVLLRVRLDPEP